MRANPRPLLPLLLMGIALLGCGQDRVLENDHAMNFKRVFGESPPPGVDVLSSVVFEYRWRLGVVSTDDWEFEIVAPTAWIEQQRKTMHLEPLRDDSFAVQQVNDRKAHPARPWYAPKGLEAYDIYYLRLTSIPYHHMLVEKQPQPDGRHRLYMSKH